MEGTFHMIKLQAKDVYYYFQALDLRYLSKFWILPINLMLIFTSEFACTWADMDEGKSFIWPYC